MVNKSKQQGAAQKDELQAWVRGRGRGGAVMGHLKSSQSYNV